MQVVVGALRRQSRLLNSLAMGTSFFADILELALHAFMLALDVALVAVDVLMLNVGLLVLMHLGHHLTLFQGLDRGLVMVLVSLAVEHLLLSMLMLPMDSLMFN